MTNEISSHVITLKTITVSMVLTPFHRMKLVRAGANLQARETFGAH
jgi:hypothetical protein